MHSSIVLLPLLALSLSIPIAAEEPNVEPDSAAWEDRNQGCIGQVCHDPGCDDTFYDDDDVYDDRIYDNQDHIYPDRTAYEPAYPIQSRNDPTWNAQPGWNDSTWNAQPGWNDSNWSNNRGNDWNRNQGNNGRNESQGNNGWNTPSSTVDNFQTSATWNGPNWDNNNQASNWNEQNSRVRVDSSQSFHPPSAPIQEESRYDEDDDHTSTASHPLRSGTMIGTLALTGLIMSYAL
ncbi:hypothetical protein BJ684DRAFT_18878 [Piptocephalis cylindrospora]|uniref:Uncharacterized protein n=1 Tax=Piptocephalis cylindrospora TaxID=1907219 RepID=A0A4P9Y7F4_9FUNG|nr:hypothetical protein BJ684DRAFT_18878 [Piptocephalis cylindrospora]|eukprot:RKP14742.1 hypothetical protein BJ684DRAFT_18878 [Piptocephalis cylindrospora]